MFQTAVGVSIPFPNKMREEYQIYEHSVRFVLSFEKLKPMLLDFIAQAEAPFFLALELPLSQAEEAELRSRDTDPFHKKVCYLDGQSRQDILDILEKYGELLLHDGISQFAVASHVTNDDFFIQKYKLIDLFSDPPTKYIPLLTKYGLTETNHLTTIWDTFSREHPGSVRRIQFGDKDVYDVYQDLVELGMYVGKVTED